MQLATHTPLVRSVRAPWETGNLILSPERMRLREQSVISQRITDFTRSRNRVSIPGPELQREVERIAHDPVLAMPIFGPDCVFGPDVVVGTDPSEWLPSSISNLLLDLDSRFLVTESGNVSAWGDNSGTDADDMTSAGAAQPLYAATDSDFGSHPSIEFDGGDEEMHGALNTAAAISGDDTPATIILVMNSIATPSAKRFFAFGHSTTGGRWDGRVAATDIPTLLKESDSGGTSQFVATSTVLTAGSSWVLVAAHSGTETNMWANDVADSGNPDATNVTTTALDDLYIGAGYDTGATTSFWNGKFARVLVYGKELSAAEAGVASDGLQTLYGIA